MENNAISIQMNMPTEVSFKDAKLTAYTKAIMACGNIIKTKSRDVAVTLAKIRAEKCYEADGFSSMGDYAEKTFNISASTASQMASVADEFYITDDPKRKELGDKLGYSVLAETVSMTPKALQDAIDNNELNENTTQKEAREIKKTAKVEGKAKRERKESEYNIKLIVVDVAKCEVSVSDVERKPISTIIPYLEEHGMIAIIETVVKAEGTKNGVYSKGVRTYYDTTTGNLAYAIFSKYVEEKAQTTTQSAVTASTVDLTSMSLEEIQKLLKAKKEMLKAEKETEKEAK